MNRLFLPSVLAMLALPRGPLAFSLKRSGSSLKGTAQGAPNSPVAVESTR